MKLYLDDDSASSLLVRLLRQEGHDVRIPAGVGLVGRDDPVHLTYAIDNGRVCLTGNHDHFFILHNWFSTPAAIIPASWSCARRTTRDVTSPRAES